MQIATWNVNSLKVRLPQVLRWLQDNPVDVLALQELKLDQDSFPQQALLEAGWNALWFGQKTYNGVALLSQNPLHAADTVYGIPGYADEQRRVITTTIQGIRVICAYFVNGEEVGSEKYAYKLAWLEQLSAFVKQEMQCFPRLALVGDFNIAPTDADVYNPALWQDRVLCSPAERIAFQQLLDLGLHDAFRLQSQPNQSFSWWSYQGYGFNNNHGLRIDHILVSDALADRVENCIIDTLPRGWERPSDHAPVIVDIV